MQVYFVKKKFFRHNIINLFTQYLEKKKKNKCMELRTWQKNRFESVHNLFICWTNLFPHFNLVKSQLLIKYYLSISTLRIPRVIIFEIYYHFLIENCFEIIDRNNNSARLMLFTVVKHTHSSPLLTLSLHSLFSHWKEKCQRVQRFLAWPSKQALCEWNPKLARTPRKHTGGGR